MSFIFLQGRRSRRSSWVEICATTAVASSDAPTIPTFQHPPSSGVFEIVDATSGRGYSIQLATTVFVPANAGATPVKSGMVFNPNRIKALPRKPLRFSRPGEFPVVVVPVSRIVIVGHCIGLPGFHRPIVDAAHLTEDFRALIRHGSVY